VPLVLWFFWYRTFRSFLQYPIHLCFRPLPPVSRISLTNWGKLRLAGKVFLRYLWRALNIWIGARISGRIRFRSS
jgi:hypothetical protein